MFRLQPFNFIKKRPRQKFLPIYFKIFQVTFLVEDSDRLLVRLVFYLSPYHFSSLSIFWVNRKTLPDTDLSFILFFNKVINEWDSYSNDSQRCRNKNRGVLQKKTVLKHFAKFTGKHLCRSLFFFFFVVLKILDNLCFMQNSLNVDNCWCKRNFENCPTRPYLYFKCSLRI